MNTITIKIAEFDRLVEALDSLRNHLQRKGELETKKEWLRIDEACEVLQVSRKTIYNKRARGEITFSKVGRAVYIRRSQIEQLLNEGETNLNDQ